MFDAGLLKNTPPGTVTNIAVEVDTSRAIVQDNKLILPDAKITVTGDATRYSKEEDQFKFQPAFSDPVEVSYGPFDTAQACMRGETPPPTKGGRAK